jgi:hypothetical protein
MGLATPWSKNKAVKLLDAAEYFQMAGLKDLCSRMLIETIKVENSMDDFIVNNEM